MKNKEGGRGSLFEPWFFGLLNQVCQAAPVCTAPFPFFKEIGCP
jgi:hypothetical protein